MKGVKLVKNVVLEEEVIGVGVLMGTVGVGVGVSTQVGSPG